MEVLISLIIGVFSLANAVIAGLFHRDFKHRKANNEEVKKRAAIREEESHLSMGLMSASAKLAAATGIAIKEGQTNGKMDAALADLEEAQSKYYTFLNKTAASKLSE